MKKCSGCKTEKQLADFNKNAHNTDGLQYLCKPCQSLSAKRCRKKNLEKFKKRDEDYYKRNKEKISAYQLDWARKNKEKVNKKSARWRKLNPQKMKVLASSWEKANRGKRKALNAKRRAQKLKATPKWMTKEDFAAIEEWYQIAKDLQWLSEESLHVDHIIPLQGKQVCGLHIASNLQILPASTNSKKGNRLCS